MTAEVENVEYQLEDQEGCRKLMTAKVAPEKVKAERDRLTREFTAMARIPGYRPGKAPAHLVQKRFQKQIDEELRRNMISETLRDIMRGNDLHVLGVGEVENVEFGVDESFSFKTTFTVSPEFDLPDYQNITVTVRPDEITDEEVDEMMENLRERAAEFEDIEDEGAELQWGHYAVLDFEGTIEGKPVSEIAGQEGQYFDQGEDFWFRMDENDSGFIPGFAEEIEDMKVGEEKDVTLTFPEDFYSDDLKGKEALFKVTLKGIKERVLPEMDDEFAKRMGQDMDLAKLREAVKTQLEQQRQQENDRMKSDQVMQKLSEQVETDLPVKMVRQETQSVAREIAQQNQQRGISEEELEENKSAIVANAERVARDRVKQRFILVRIAEKEGIEATSEDVERRIQAMAMQYRLTPEKVRKQLEKNDSLGAIEEEAMIGKTLDYLMANATVEVSETAGQEPEAEEESES